MKQCVPKIEEQHPKLQTVHKKGLENRLYDCKRNSGDVREVCERWVREREMLLGSELDIQPVSNGGDSLLG